jgi:hypothetical protein
MRNAWLFAILLLTACRSDPPAPAPAETAAPVQSAPAKPIVHSLRKSDQKLARQGPGSDDSRGVPTVDAGVGFRDQARTGCSDQKCIGANCTRLCSKWVADNPPPPGEDRNRVYFGCIGTCLTEPRP